MKISVDILRSPRIAVYGVLGQVKASLTPLAARAILT
jgi:hypothetical protein